MVSENVSECPDCKGKLEYFDTTHRIVRTKGRVANHIKIRRLRCSNCGGIHREIPDSIFPYKQYEAEVIKGVIEGIITSETLGFENYPCEMTMLRWIRSQNMHPLF